MAVVIPNYPAATTTITLKSSAVDQTPYLGGPVQRLARLGDRWSYTVDLRPMGAAQSRPLIARLLQGLTERVLCPVKIEGVSSVGQTDVTANSGSGRSITVQSTDQTSNKVEGQFFSLVKNGVRYLHQVSAINGQTISFFPALKVPITGGEPLEFIAPKIEGFLDGAEQGWTISMVAAVGLTFRINEAS